MENAIRVLTGTDVLALLDGREREIISLVQSAYEAHERGESSLPQSQFVLFPGAPRNRIIALPGFLGADTNVAGVKWIASFPNNTATGLDRASAVIVLNSVVTGHPVAILEGSIISARRTAASAALGAWHLRGEAPVSHAGIVGCGLINHEILRFLQAAFSTITHCFVYDLHPERAEKWAARSRRESPGIDVRVAASVDEVLSSSELTSFATTAATPHVADLSMCPRGSTILHISLRDLAPELILAADNVVDDIDHVCRAQTSIHLAEQACGHRRFIRCTLAAVTAGKAPARAVPDRVTVFSPFGLGILDLALGNMTYKLAQDAGAGLMLPSFLPPAQWQR